MEEPWKNDPVAEPWQNDPAVEQEAAIEPGSRGIVGDITALQKGIADTATFGFGDEMKAGLQAIVPNLVDEQLQNMSVGERYNYYLNKARQEAELAQQESPGMYVGGQIAGAFVPGMAGAKTLQGASTLGKYGRGLGLGALQGGIYGVGQGEGTIDRLGGGAIGTLYGGLGGVAATGLGQAAGAAGRAIPATAKQQMGSVRDRAINVFSKKRGLQTPQVGELAKTQDEIFTKTAGQKGQSPQAQRLEAEARGGVYGEEAGRLIRQADITQSRERRAFISQLADIDKPGDAYDAIENAFDTIVQGAKSAKRGVDNAYELAREGGKTKINVDDLKDGLFAKIGQTKREAGYSLEDMPMATGRVKDLARLIRRSSGGKFDDQSLDALEKWRKKATNSLNSTNDKTEKRFLRQMVSDYDDFMYKTANEAVDSADEQAILAFREAVRKRREYGQMYESDKFVRDLVEGKKGIDDAVKDLIGTGSIVGKKRMEGTYDAILKAAGDDAAAVQTDLQAGFAKKLLEQSIEGMEAGGAQEFLSPRKTQRALEGLFKNNRKFAKKLYGEENFNAANKAIDELKLIADKLEGTQNYSGSGYTVLRVLNGIPFINVASSSIESAGKSRATGKVAKSLGQTIRDIRLKPQSALFRPGQAGLMATAVGEE